THTGPSHTHGWSDTTSTNGAHQHALPEMLSAGSHSHSFSTGGPSNTHVAGSFTGAAVGVPTSNHTHSGTTGGGGGHTHGFESLMTSSGAHTHSGSGTTGSGGTGNTGASGTAATGASGTGDTGTANPPYLVVNYIVKV